MGFLIDSLKNFSGCDLQFLAMIVKLEKYINFIKQAHPALFCSGLYSYKAKCGGFMCQIGPFLLVHVCSHN